MATTIVTKNSSTAAAVPTAAQLVQGELAVNVVDKRLYTEDNAGAVVELGTNPSSLTVSGNIDVDGVTNLDAVDIDGAVDMASTLTVTGEITANGGIALGDNDTATFGDGDDLQIYHDGSNSFIKDIGTGDLRIDAGEATIVSNTSGILNLYSSDYRIEAGVAFGDFRITAPRFRIFEDGNLNFQIDGGSVDLRYAGSSKLTTTNTGIDVTGTATMDGLVVDGVAKVLGTAGNTLIIADATETNGYQLKANTSASADYGFLIENLAGKDLFKVESNNDISFYEDTGTTPKFFWDASAESLGINTDSPSEKLHVNGTALMFGARMSSNNGSTYWDVKRDISTGHFHIADDSLGNVLTIRQDSGNVGIGTSDPSAS